jgi:hypothetical protein
MSEGNQLRQDLELTEHNIDEAVCRQAATYAHYSSAYSAKENQVKHQKLYISTLEAALDQKIRSLAVASGEKMTEALLDRRMKGTDTWISEQKKLINLETELAQIEGILTALRHKKDMIITMANRIRTEMQTPNAFRNTVAEPTFPTAYAKQPAA